MPSLEGATEWFNATGASAEARSDGHPTLVHFWSVSCDDCRENLARVSEWRDRYSPRGLRVVAIHTPQSEDDADTEIVREAVMTCRISEPCAVDNEHRLAQAFRHNQNELPAYYLFDGAGKLNAFASGKDGLDAIAAALEGVFASSSTQTEQ